MRYNVCHFNPDTNSATSTVVDGGLLTVEQVVETFELTGHTVFTVTEVPSGLVVHRSGFDLSDVASMEALYA